jgi:hypothetical protein
MNAVTTVSRTEARTSPHQVDTRGQSRVHRTGGLGGDASGNSSGSEPEEVPTGLWHEVARDGEDGAPPLPREPRALLGLGDSGIVFSV